MKKNIITIHSPRYLWGQTGVKVYSIQYLESFVKYCTVFEENKKKGHTKDFSHFSGLNESRVFKQLMVLKTEMRLFTQDFWDFLECLHELPHRVTSFYTHTQEHTQIYVWQLGQEWC